MGTIYILHGLFGSSRNWRSIIQKLKYPVKALDLRNHGSNADPSLMTWDNLYADLKSSVDWSEKPVLLGHSLGGQVIMQSLFRDKYLQDKIAACIIVDIANAPLFGPKIRNYLKAMMEIDGLLPKEASLAFQQITGETNQAIVRFLFTNYGSKIGGTQVSGLSGSSGSTGYMGSTGSTGYGFRIPLKEISRSLDILQETQMAVPAFPIETPTLFMRGQNSNYVDAVEGEKFIKNAFKNAKIETIPNAGHWIHHEQPENFIRAVEDYVSSRIGVF